jgi:serine/threonine protein kinase
VNPTRWRQVNDLFHALLERPPAARAAYLNEATATDPELRREVESLLESHERSSSHEFLEAPAWGVGADLILDDTAVSLTGRQLGPYLVGEELGRGGMGVVYAAEDTRLGRTVALKALPDEYARDSVRRERLTREARAAAALSHPAIATVYALEELDGALYIVSELVHGRTLREELRDGPIAPARLIPTLVDIASALAAAHARGIVHRDLKPENIVRRDDGQIKVLDFGLATMDRRDGVPTRTRLTEVGSALGTPGYMAPEQLSGDAVDARSDLFAFGVLAWELATGEHPFGTDAATLLARMTALMEGRADSLSRPLPIPGLDAIARRCLRASPRDRYQSADALLADLRALSGVTGISHGSGPSIALGSGAMSAVSPAGDALWWWQFHQGTVGVLNALTPILAWFVRAWAQKPYGGWVFYAILALATVSATLRFNLMFIARVHPTTISVHRARLAPWVTVAEALLALALLVAAALVAGPHDAMAAVLVSFAIATVASLGIIEPATTSAAGISHQPPPDGR